MHYRYSRNRSFCPRERKTRFSPSSHFLLALFMLVLKSVSSLVVPLHNPFIVEWQAFTHLRSTSSSSDYLSSIGTANGATELTVMMMTANATSTVTMIRVNQSGQPFLALSTTFLLATKNASNTTSSCSLITLSGHLTCRLLT